MSYFLIKEGKYFPGQKAFLPNNTSTRFVWSAGDWHNRLRLLRAKSTDLTGRTEAVQLVQREPMKNAFQNLIAHWACWLAEKASRKPLSNWCFFSLLTYIVWEHGERGKSCIRMILYFTYELKIWQTFWYDIDKYLQFDVKYFNSILVSLMKITYFFNLMTYYFMEQHWFKVTHRFFIWLEKNGKKEKYVAERKKKTDNKWSKMSRGSLPYTSHISTRSLPLDTCVQDMNQQYLSDCTAILKKWISLGSTCLSREMLQMDPFLFHNFVFQTDLSHQPFISLVKKQEDYTLQFWNYTVAFCTMGVLKNSVTPHIQKHPSGHAPLFPRKAAIMMVLQSEVHRSFHSGVGCSETNILF